MARFCILFPSILFICLLHDRLNEEYELLRTSLRSASSEGGAWARSTSSSSSSPASSFPILSSSSSAALSRFRSLVFICFVILFKFTCLRLNDSKDLSEQDVLQAIPVLPDHVLQVLYHDKSYCY